MDIFEGIEENQKTSLLNCLQTVEKSYKKGEMIFDINQKLTSALYVSDGRVQLIKDDYNGSKIIISQVHPNQTFGISLAYSENPSTVSAYAIEDTRIMFLNLKRVLTVCSNACPFHQKLIQNIIKIISEKNLIHQERIELLSKKTLREKILSFLYKEKIRMKTDVFEISYSREQMAHYLGADRSALSRELSKMKSEKIIDFHKNSFRLF